MNLNFLQAKNGDFFLDNKKIVLKGFSVGSARRTAHDVPGQTKAAINSVDPNEGVSQIVFMGEL